MRAGKVVLVLFYSLTMRGIEEVIDVLLAIDEGSNQLADHLLASFALLLIQY